MKDREYNALNFALNLGKKVKENYPEVAELYRSGKSQREIAEFLSKKGDFQNIHSKFVLENAVKCALIGAERSRKNRGYDGLMPQEEYSAISQENRVKNGENISRICREEKKGIYAITKSQRKIILRNATISRGGTPWEQDEINEAFSLKGKYLGSEIAEILNKKHHSSKLVRNQGKLNSMYYRERKRRIA